MKRTLISSLAGAATVVIASVAGAQTPVHWSGKLDPKAKVKPAVGATVPVQIEAKIDEGWHIYSLTTAPGPTPTAISLPKTKDTLFTIKGKITQSDYETKFDEGFGTEIQLYERQALFTVPLQITPKAKAGKNEVTILAHYQVCNSTGCLPPTTEKVKVALDVAEK